MIRRFAAAVSVIVLGGALLGPVPAAIAASLNPVADTYVDDSRPTRNYGTSNVLRVEGNPQRVTYLRYEPGANTSAALQIRSERSMDDIRIFAVDDDTWQEGSITWDSRPSLGQLLARTGPTAPDRSYTVDVSAGLDGGALSLALVTPDSSGMSLSSREGGSPPQLLSPAPPSPDVFTISRTGDLYDATSNLGVVHGGELKDVVEQAVIDLEAVGGGRVQFTAGDFDLGSDHFELYDVFDLEFAGAGMNATVLRNETSESTDTEPFDFTGANSVTIRDLTISAGGAFRSTSDAIDFDAGNDSRVERVKVVQSRGRGIVFDGKDTGRTADRNVVRDCEIEGVPSDGIELLASRNNIVEGCTVTDVAGHGIQITKSSTSASIPNKTSDDNELRNNTVTNSGQDGINVNSGSRNLIVDNVVTNSSDDKTGRDGIRIGGHDSVPCNDNVVRSNTATDTDTPKTQKYGINISTALCHRTVLEANSLAGNLIGDLRDSGTDTIVVTTPDTEAPSDPGSVTAVASATNVTVTWSAASDNVGVTGYPVYRDGSLLTTVPGSTLEFVDLTAAPTTTYQYSVSAVDAAGLESSPAIDANLVTTPAAEDATDWAPIADTYVDDSSPATSRGSSTKLLVDNSPVRRSYLRFSVAGTPAGDYQTKLRIYANSNHNSGFEVNAVGAGTWDENSSFDTVPAPGALIGSSGPVTGGSYVDIDLGQLVTGDGTYEFALTGTSNTNLSLASRESGQPPSLILEPTVLDTEAPSAPGSMTAVAASATQVDLAWTAASDNVGVTEYFVARDGSPLSTVSGSTLDFVDSTALPTTTYQYSVSAVDAAGLESSATVALPVTTPAATAATEWTPTADTYVDASAPSKSYGSRTKLRVDNSPVKRSYLRFSVEGAPTGDYQTKLRIYANSNHNSGLEVRAVGAGTWDENSTYDTTPAPGALIAASGPLAAGSYVDIDLGQLVTGDGTYELALTGTSNTALSLASRESGQPPSLMLVAP